MNGTNALKRNGAACGEPAARVLPSRLNLIVSCWLLVSATGCVAESGERTAESSERTAASSDWTALLDASLSQWEMYLSYRHKPGYAGDVPLDEDGNILQPIGYNENVGDVFSVVFEDGEPVLKVTGEIYGCLFTKQAFENYHLTLQVRWGEQKWAPRTALLRDSGILYHSIGESGVDYWRSWMLSQEFQIMEGHMGDYWNVATSAIDIRAFMPEGRMSAVASVKQPFLAFGTGTERGGYCMRSADHESPPGEWTTLELIAVGDKSVHVVNGEVVMVLKNSRYMDGDTPVPLTSGRIQLQSEAAEVYYKDIRIKSLDGLPLEYAAYFE